LVYEKNDIDLNTLVENFTGAADYPTDVSLAELIERQKQPDFLVLLYETQYDFPVGKEIDGFMIAYQKNDCLWIHQVFHRPQADLQPGREAMRMAKQWARNRGLTSIMGETRRKEMAALTRHGFKEHAVVIKCEI